jgi:hypothetical protein
MGNSLSSMPSPCDVFSSMKRLIYIIGRKSVTTASTSIRWGMNPGSSESCEGESARKSHGEPHVIARIWLLMASHGDRSPRLTLKAGRTAGCNAGRLPNLLLPPTRVRRDAAKVNENNFEKSTKTKHKLQNRTAESITADRVSSCNLVRPNQTTTQNFGSSARIMVSLSSSTSSPAD